MSDRRSTTGSDSFPETGIVLPEYANRSSRWLVQYGRDAAEAGFDSVWCGEGWGYNPFQILARIGERTDCGLGTSIANVFARSPTALAANALALSDLSDGRFVLGIGSSTPPVVEKFHGAEFENPIRRIRETIEIVELALSGNRIEYDGEIFSLSGFRLNHAEGVRVPILNAALGRTNVAMSIDYADGILPHLLPLTAIDDAIDDAADRAHSSPADDFHVTPSVPTSVHEDGERARDVFRRHVAYYAGSTDFYNGVIADNGFPDEAKAIRDAWRAGDHDEAARVTSDELIDALGIAGTPDEARDQFRDLRADDSVDTLLVSFPQGATDEMYELTLETLPVE